MNDLKFAVRQLSKQPGFALAIMLTLAVGLGSATVVIAIANAVHYRLVVCPEPQRLVLVSQKRQSTGLGSQVSYPNFCDWRAQNRVFEDMAIMEPGRVNCRAEGDPARVAALRVSAGYLATLRVQPIRGRGFQAEDCRPGAAPVAILSHGFWQRQFAGRADIIGCSITLDSLPHTVIGIMPHGYRFLTSWENDPQIWRPLTLDPSEGRGNQWMSAVARLKPGMSLAAAQAEMDGIAARLAAEYPEANAGWGASVRSLTSFVAQLERSVLPMLLGAVAVVLIVCCANVAGLLVGRAADRCRDLAVRSALGASAWQTVRPWGLENLLLALGGGVLGLGWATLATRAVNWFLGRNNMYIPEVVVDGRVTLVAAGLVCLTAFLLSWLLYRTYSGAKIERVLREVGRGLSGSRSLRRLGYGLTVSQVALSAALLMTAGLLLKSLGHLVTADPGFDPHGAWTAELPLPESRYASGERQAAFFGQLLERLTAQDDTKETAVASNLPLLYENMYTFFEIPGRPHPPNSDEYLVNMTAVSPSYFSVLRIPMRYGRSFSADQSERNSVIVNESLARRHFQDRSPLGERISILGRECTIVGVVGDVRHEGVRRACGQQVYLSFRHLPRSKMFVITRPGSGRLAVAPMLRSVVSQVDPEQPLSFVRELKEVVGASLASDRLLLYLVGAFGSVAMVLAAVGVYGVIAYWVAQHSREIGIRMALGATAGGTYRLVLSRGARLTAVGLVIGLAGAWGTSRLVASQLYQVQAADPLVCAGSVLLLTAAAAVACWIPARRAARIDPMAALRCE